MDLLKMYSLLKMGDFPLAMLVYWRVGINFLIYKQPV